MQSKGPTEWNYMALMGNDLLAGATATETALSGLPVPIDKVQLTW
jgi:hypothetical protein